MDLANLSSLSETDLAFRLLAALFLGALIGLQRGWVARHLAAGERIAGIRTHALVGLLGGFSALLSAVLTPWVFPVAFLGVAAIALVAYRARLQHERNFSITGLIGLLLTFMLGAIALSVSVFLAAAGAVVTALILDYKAEIHGLLAKLEEHELDAGLKLLLISVVVLPLLPNQGYGPGEAINPYEIWWLVVLIAGISFVGYFAVRMAGARRGILFTSLFAGLSSTTALTLNFAKLSRQAPEASRLLAAGILIACGTMFPRLLVYAYLINPALIGLLVMPVITMAVALYAPAVFIWRGIEQTVSLEKPVLERNPLDLSSAVYFAVLITVILLLGEWLRNAVGDAGIYLLAAASGIADVDAITLSLTRMSLSDTTLEVAVLGIVIASAVNNLVKAGLTVWQGSAQLWRLVLVPMVVSLVLGLLLATLG
ncbi:MgtC/SapB family protein [Saccharospirillum alexandrii]|uniref:MgtC/SapB family protein n=1 Tax=Saccharospirillum alexandrii TaxID=2448477 RepID=UPI000FDACD2A|nr:MgtC/SapB family protein [Saccharospirillum alexandrii]